MSPAGAVPPVLGVILAGGLARRMGGGDKALRPLGGVTLLDRVIARAAPQVSALWLNANGDPSRFARWDLPVVPDDVPGAPGPLAGILAALDLAAATWPDAELVASFPCDAPFIPRDLVARLAAARRDQGAAIAVAASGGRTHPVAALWPVALRHDLRRALVEEESARSSAGPAATASPSPNSPATRSTPSSTATRPRTWRRRNGCWRGIPSWNDAEARLELKDELRRDLRREP